MKATLKNNKVFINGQEAGYYSKVFAGDWIAVFNHNGLSYTRIQTKLCYLKELVNSIVND